MKAIIKVNKNSSFAKYNFKTFEVEEIVDKDLICLSINGTKTDFSVKEVIIVDFDREFEKIVKETTIPLEQQNKFNQTDSTKQRKIKSFLTEYKKINNII